MCNHIFNYHVLLMWLNHPLGFNFPAQRVILNLWCCIHTDVRVGTNISFAKPAIEKEPAKPEPYFKALKQGEAEKQNICIQQNKMRLQN